MKRYPLFFLLYLLCYSLHSQDTTEVTGPNFIPILTYWNVGDTFRYTVEKGEKKFKEGVLIDSTGKQYDMTLVVSEATDSSYVVRVFQEADWSEMIQLLSKSNIKVGDLKPLIKILDFEHLEYVIDKNGSFLEVRNLEKLGQATALILDQYVEANYKSEETRKQAEAVLSNLKKPEFLYSSILEEVKVMHKFHGLQYAQDSIWIFDVKYPNPFSPSEILIKKNSLFTSLPDDWDGIVSLRNNIIIEGKDALSLVRGFLTESELISKTGDFFEKNPPHYEYNINYAIDLYTGQVYAMYYEKLIYWGGQKVREVTYHMKSL